MSSSKLSKKELKRRAADGFEEDEEEEPNRIGDVPLEWYEDYDHIGYDVEGQKMMKGPDWAKRRDAIEEFLDAKDDPQHWRKFYDAKNNRDLVLTDEDLKVVHALATGRTARGVGAVAEGKAKGDKSDDFLDDPDWWPLLPVDHQMAVIPTGSDNLSRKQFFGDHKRITELLRIGKLINKGWIKPPTSRKTEIDPTAGLVLHMGGDEVQRLEYKDLWAEDNGLGRPTNVPPPPMILPGHGDSYNPPNEYIPTEEEKKKIEQSNDQAKRRALIPTNYGSMRRIPQYSHLMEELYSRCLELYLMPRSRKPNKNKKGFKSDDLLPTPPSLDQFKPFPTAVVVSYRGHGKAAIRSVAPDPRGQWLASGDDNGVCKIWEIDTGRCVKTMSFGAERPVRNVSWCPNPSTRILAIAAGSQLFLLAPSFLHSPTTDAAQEIISGAAPAEATKQKKPNDPKWRLATEEEKRILGAEGVALVVDHAEDIAQCQWHHKGDYIGVLTQMDILQPIRNTHLYVHRVSAGVTQKLSVASRTTNSGVQCFQFHPILPRIFVATQRIVRLYDLAKGRTGTSLIKKAYTHCRWISTMSVHPSGNHLIVGTYDKRVCWFDMDLACEKPWKVMRHHKYAVRRVAFSAKYPLFASCSDDGRTHLFHAHVPADTFDSPTIVPLRVLRGHAITDDLGVLDVVFHPTLPWLFSAGSDGVIQLHTDKDLFTFQQ